MKATTEINPCTLHVVVFLVAIYAELPAGTIHVDKKHSQNAMTVLATVMCANSSVVRGTFAHFLPMSRRISVEPMRENAPPTFGIIAHAVREPNGAPDMIMFLVRSRELS